MGSDEQKNKLLPDLVSLNKLISFGLTEPGHGSDATGMKTTARKVEGGFVLNGDKRWIGGGTISDYIIIWAKNADEGNKIQGFVVEKRTKGLKTTKIEGKLALRMVQK